MAEAIRIMDQPAGYRVHFEHAANGTLSGDWFPEGSEPLIKTEGEAWRLAQIFAARTVGRCVNIYVVDGDHLPVPGYERRRIDNRR